MTSTVGITVNGNPVEVGPETTVADLVAGFSLPERGVALAVDGDVVPRSLWSGTPVPAGARVELVTAMQGG
jgi:sulfur carrier protein